MIIGLHGRMKAIIFCIVIICSIGLHGVCFAQEDAPPEADRKTAKNEKLPETKRDIRGVVVDMLTGEPVSGAKVSLLKETVTSDGDGRFVMKNVSEYHAIQMTARITTDLDVIIGCSYFSVPTNYYPISATKGNKVDIQIINMLEDKEVSLRISEYSEGNIDKYCATCHEPSPCLIEDDFGKSMTGKVNLKGLLVKQSKLEDYIKQMRIQKMTLDRYKNIRYEDSHPKGMDITKTESFTEGRVVLPEGLTLKKGKVIVCDSCHTRHESTEFGQFVLMDFTQRESICIKCHK